MMMHEDEPADAQYRINLLFLRELRPQFRLYLPPVSQFEFPLNLASCSHGPLMCINAD